jgi:hypothetical protein
MIAYLRISPIARRYARAGASLSSKNAGITSFAKILRGGDQSPRQAIMTAALAANSSAERTALRVKFPDLQGKYREFLRFWSSAGRLCGENTLSALWFFSEFPTQRNREF